MPATPKATPAATEASAQPTKVAAPKGKKTTKVAQKKTLKFTIDCSQPVDDGILDPSSFEKFLHDKIKVAGKAGNLGDAVSVSRDKSKLTVTATTAFSKRYLKYLTKKYLKKHQLRDWLRVIAKTKGSYELKYFNIHDQEEQEDEE
ncbi:putative 60S ribosomal protein L22 [Planoprotostelium fungivorum]|uniref:Large ribosomal subunit protein eL22 n=1 Tax=Planoprotostelium fungivorum TaxID=1890364 RepID=A0A2P6NG30_9EUKA|nr:putative 60S ribosomal protein L22 [Planoprotostelium fungivorum]